MPFGGNELHSILQILVIAYSFPPDAEVGALRMGHFCRYLPSFGIQPIALTVHERFSAKCDHSLPLLAQSRVVRTTMLPTPVDFYHRWKARPATTEQSANGSDPVRTQQGRGYFRRHALALVQTPDPACHWGWYLPAVQAAGKLIGQEPIAAILSTGPPWISHLIARHLKKKYQLPWIADFRDPWASTPFRRDLPCWQQRLNQRLEASCIQRADRVLSTTDRLHQGFTRSYPSVPVEKFVTLTNGFDDLGAPLPSSETKCARRLILHLGSIYGLRRIDNFCQAISSLIRAGKIDAQSFKIVFLGDTSPALATAMRQQVPDLFRDDCIEFQPRVSRQQAQRIMWDADLLLLFQGGFRLQVPAKFYEYLQTGKPIFAVAQKGALTDVLESTDSGVWADPGDPTALAASFLSALKRTAQPPEEIQRRWAGQYHYRSLTERLAGLVREVASRSGRVEWRRWRRGRTLFRRESANPL